MAVPKGQGRETPAKIEQSKVKGRSEDPVRTSGRTALLPKPNLHRAGPGEEKTYKKRTQRALSLSLPRRMGRSSLCICGSMCPHALTNFPASF